MKPLGQIVIASCFFAAACGGRSATESSSSGNASDAGPSACFSSTGISTRSGPCASDGNECDGTCGSCASPQQCVDQRCYDAIGPEPGRDPGLLRSLYQDAEGETCIVSKGGALERVVATIWNDGIKSVVMEVDVTCDGTESKAATVTVAGKDLPTYEAAGTTGIVPFVLDPPITIPDGATVTVKFHAVGAVEYSASAVSGIYLKDVDPSCSFVADGPVAADDSSSWDYAAQLELHRP